MVLSPLSYQRRTRRTIQIASLSRWLCGEAEKAPAVRVSAAPMCAFWIDRPTSVRPNTVRNLDAWYAPFHVQPRDKLHLKPEERVRLW